jgi:hypothetical protein
VLRTQNNVMCRPQRNGGCNPGNGFTLRRQSKRWVRNCQSMDFRCTFGDRLGIGEFARHQH